jgi:hypothetical protein
MMTTGSALFALFRIDVSLAPKTQAKLLRNDSVAATVHIICAFVIIKAQPLRSAGATPRPDRGADEALQKAAQPYCAFVRFHGSE